jgi:hypothetical protein
VQRLTNNCFHRAERQRLHVAIENGDGVTDRELADIRVGNCSELLVRQHRFHHPRDGVRIGLRQLGAHFRCGIRIGRRRDRRSGLGSGCGLTSNQKASQNKR